MEKRLIHLVDDDESIRRSASFMLKTSGFDVVTYASGVLFLKALKGIALGCILLDVRMPEMDGLEVQRELRSRGVGMPVIVLTGHGDVSTAVQAMKDGAFDFIEKPFEKAILLESIESAFARLERSDSAVESAQAAAVKIAALSPREQDVLRGLVRGHPNKTIGYDLGISPRTVEIYRANLMTKLEVRSLSEALRVAFAAGLAEELT